MKGTSLIGALVAGAAGAIAWAAIIKAVDFEIGYVAWGIGIIVGFASVAMGGKGVQNGVMCAILALASIWVGKAVGAKWSITGDAMKSFMSADNKDSGLTAEEQAKVAGLSESEKTALANEMAANFTWGEAFKMPVDNPDVLDLVFAFFGVASAFTVGSGRERSQPTAASLPPPAQPPAASL